MRTAESFEDKWRIWLKRPTYHQVLDLALKSPENSVFQIERSTIRQHHVYLDNTMQYKWQYFRRDIAILLIYRRSVYKIFPTHCQRCMIEQLIFGHCG